MTPDWDARYDTDDYVFGTEPSRFLVDRAHWLKPRSRVLCVADGEGRNGVWLARQDHDVLAMDGAAKALAKARRLAARHAATLTLEQADIAHWTWTEAAFDAVVAIFIQFADPALRRQIFTGMKRTVRPGGLVLLHGYRPEQLAYGTGRPKRLENLYDRDLLAGTFADFEILELSAYDADVQEGSGHSGRSALISLVARRPVSG